MESVAHALPTLAEHGSHRWVVTLHFTTINAEETMMFINEAVLRMLARVQTRAHDEDGQGLAEYGLILALIAVVCIIALTALGEGVAAKIGEVTAGLS